MTVPPNARALAPVPILIWRITRAGDGTLVDWFAEGTDQPIWHNGRQYRPADIIHTDTAIELVYHDAQGRRSTVHYPQSHFVFTSTEVDPE